MKSLISIRRNIFFLTLILLILQSCHKQELIEEESCKDDCTTFNGKIETIDHIGIPNVTVSLKHISDNMVIVSSNKLGKSKTDKNGNYEIKAYIDDALLGSNYRQWFELEISKIQIDKSISEEYLKPDEMLEHNPYTFLPDIYHRDTIITKNYIVPKKGRIQVKLHDFDPIIDMDFFSVQVLFNYDIYSPEWNSINKGSKVYRFANKLDSITVLNTETTLNNFSQIEICKRKNGVYEIIKKTIYINNTDIYKMDFYY